HNLGYLLYRTGRVKQAEVEYRAARALQQQLVAVLPAPEYRRDLALSCIHLGGLLKDTDLPKEAEAEYRAARALFAKLVAEFPAAPEHRRGLAMSRHSLGTLLAAT